MRKCKWNSNSMRTFMFCQNEKEEGTLKLWNDLKYRCWIWIKIFIRTLIYFSCKVVHNSPHMWPEIFNICWAKLSIYTISRRLWLHPKASNSRAAYFCLHYWFQSLKEMKKKIVRSLKYNYATSSFSRGRW